MFRLIKTQMKIMLNQKGAKIAFYSMMLAVFINYYQNIRIFRDIEKTSIPSIMELGIFSDNSIWGWYILEFICFLLVLPGGMSFAIDKKTNFEIYLTARSNGKYRYITSKIIAVFLTTFIVFSVPLLIELALNYNAFHCADKIEMQAISNYLLEDSGQISINRKAFMVDEYIYNPELYSLVRIILFGLFASLMSLVPMAFSCVCNKFLAYLMIPVFFLVSLFGRTEFKVLGHNIPHNYVKYLIWTNQSLTGEQIIWFNILLGLVAFGSVLFVYIYEGGKEV